LTREFADGGFMNDVYAKGGELADIQKMKKALISKAKSKGLYENFGEKEVRVLEDKYGYTDNVRDFNNWAMKFDLSRMADGGGVQDRKMKVGDKVYRYYTIYEPYKEVIDKSKIYTIVSIDEQEPSFKNAYAKKIIKTNDGVIHSENTVVKVDYVENRGFAEGGMFDNNDGFMKADNNRNFRYPEGEVRVDAIDEPIDLTDNVSYAYNEVTVMPLNDEIDLRESNNMRVGKPYVPKNRNPNKMMAVNPRMIITDFPTPNSNKHKND
jgi:hypothetical protein